MVMRKKASAAKKAPKAAKSDAGLRQMAAGEFKAKCLAIMDELNETGRPLIITKRGVPVMKAVPIQNATKKKDDFIGRLEGIIKINGDPDDLVKPIFPLEDWDMLK
jgi:antitoxin (DNA-binding transcriptional repressor) of toxin-antitoxin stability system